MKVHDVDRIRMHTPRRGNVPCGAGDSAVRAAADGSFHSFELEPTCLYYFRLILIGSDMRPEALRDAGLGKRLVFY